MLIYFKSSAIALVLVVTIISCSSIRAVDLTKVQIGMSKAQVEAALKKRPDKVVAAKHLTNPESVIEIIQYSQNGVTPYNLYFVNDKLEEWHEVHSNERTPIL